MYIAWTTVESAGVGEQLALGAVNVRLAVCAQVDATPLVSYYQWEGKTEQAREFRVVFKCVQEQLQPLETWIHQRHPYVVPQWIVLRAEHVSEKYLSWAEGTARSPLLNSANPPFPSCHSTKASKAPPESSSNATS